MSRSVVEDLIDNAALPMAEKMVLIIIARHGRGTDGSGGYPNLRRIATLAGASRSTVHPALVSLRDRGILTWESGNAGKKKANVYTLHLDKVPKIDWTLSSGSTAEPLNPSSGSTADPLNSSSVDRPVDRFGPSSGSPSGSTGGRQASTKQVLEANTEAKDDDDRSSPSGDGGASAPGAGAPPSGDGNSCDAAFDNAASQNGSSSSSFSLSSIQKFWNEHRGEMRESRTLAPYHRGLFFDRARDGLSEELCQQAILKMAATPYFRGEVNGTLGDLAWLLKLHKESGEPNFVRVLNGEYDKRVTKKPLTSLEKELIYGETERKPSAMDREFEQYLRENAERKPS